MRPFWIGAIWLLSAAPALAADGGRAAQLFEEAQAQMNAGDYASACARLEESQRLDPQLGTQLHLANCYEKRGLIASAFLNFRAAAGLAAQRGEPREAVARRRAEALEPRLSTLQLRVAQPDTPGLRIVHDGKPIERASWNQTLPVDPGSHALVASAPGRRDYEHSYTLAGDSARAELSVPALEPLVVAALPSTPARSAPRQPLAASAPAAARGDGQRLAGYIVAGAGLVGIGVGSALGLIRNAKVGEIEDACGSPCNIREEETAKLQRVHGLHESAQTYASGAVLGFVLGGAALVGGIVLVLSAPGAERASELSIGISPGALTLRARVDAL